MRLPSPASPQAAVREALEGALANGIPPDKYDHLLPVRLSPRLG